MADILIKNIEMPSETSGKEIFMYNDGRTICRNIDEDRWVEVEAIPVPEHGNLTDADVIRKSLLTDCPCHGCERFHEEGACMNCQWDRFMKLIDTAPVILGACNG